MKMHIGFSAIGRGVLVVAFMASATAAEQRPDVRTPGVPSALGPSDPVRTARATIADVAWMAGVWIGTTGSSTVEERWTPAAGGSMLGVGRTLRSDVMREFEFLRVAEREGSLVYIAMPNGRSPATEFVLTGVDARSATFENSAHDFPKMIRYRLREDGTMEAVVSGDASQRPQTFVFTRQQDTGPRW